MNGPTVFLNIAVDLAFPIIERAQELVVPCCHPSDYPRIVFSSSDGCG